MIGDVHVRHMDVSWLDTAFSMTDQWILYIKYCGGGL